MLRVVACGVAALLLQGCLPEQTIRLRQEHADVLHQDVHLAVPFIPQADYQCGPASLGMELAWLHHPVSQQSLIASLYVPGRKGAFKEEMIVQARRQGMMVLPVGPEVKDVLLNLEQHRAPIVLLNLALNFWPRWHFAVVTGFDAQRQEFILHSGQHEQERLPLPVMERVWVRGGSWAIVLIDPDHLPADVPVADLLKSAVDLERVHPRLATHVYAALAIRQPKDERIPLFLGNAFRSAGDLVHAEAAYRQAMDLQPNDWVVMNNLADLLWHEARLAEAKRWAQQAVLHAPVSSRSWAEATLQEINHAHP